MNNPYTFLEMGANGGCECLTRRGFTDASYGGRLALGIGNETLYVVLSVVEQPELLLG